MDTFPIDYTAGTPLHRLLDFPCALTVVDVGANPIDGAPPYAPLLEAGHTRVVGFEPSPPALEELNARKGPHETYLPHAVGDGQRHTLRICRMPGMTSLLEPNPEVLGLFYGFGEWGRVVAREEVDTVRLDDVPETAGLDVLKIDVQGAELMVFENATDRLDGALLVHTEVEFMPMYVGQPLFSEVERFLRSHGFQLHCFAPLVTRDFRPMLRGTDPYAGHSQLLWADAVFVKDMTRLDRLDDGALLRLSAILHDCYGSHDLVLLLLREHDRRTGGTLGERFFHIITGRQPAP